MSNALKYGNLYEAMMLFAFPERAAMKEKMRETHRVFAMIDLSKVKPYPSKEQAAEMLSNVETDLGEAFEAVLSKSDLGEYHEKIKLLQVQLRAVQSEDDVFGVLDSCSSILQSFQTRD